MKCSLKVSGKDNLTGSQQTMIDEQYMMVWAENGGERSISTRRNGSLTVRREKLAGIKKCQIENAYISDSWQPHSPFQIGHKFMIFYNCSCFDTSYFNLENEWGGKCARGIFFSPQNKKKKKRKRKKKVRGPPSEKLNLNAKKGELAHTLLSLTSQLCLCAPGFVAHWRQSTKLLWRVTPSKALWARTHEYLYAD